MLASNLFNFVDEFWNNDEKIFSLSLNDAILQGCLITHQGEIVHPTFLQSASKRE
jgi:NAD(P) transhydrogenase subunit alpha